MDGLPNFLTHGAPLRARFARAGAPLKCPYKGLEPHYVEGDKLSTYNGHILQRKRVVIPETGQQQLLKGNAHPGKAAIQKNVARSYLW